MAPEDEDERRAARERRRWRWAGVLLVLAVVTGVVIGKRVREHPLPPAYDRQVDAGKWPVPPDLASPRDLEQYRALPRR